MRTKIRVETEEQRNKRWDQWFGNTKREFCPAFAGLAGKPIVYVEIGCWAGASASWVAANVLTHPDSRGYGIDPYPSEWRHPVDEISQIKERAHQRLREAVGDRWIWIEHPSVRALRRLEDWTGGRKVDALYVDGAHAAHNVVQDFALAWHYLQPGSVVIFDDYLPRKELPRRLERSGTGAPHVVTAYEAIRSVWGNMLEDVLPPGTHRRQRAVRVVSMKHTPKQ